ncbi:MAG: hypothetical protein Q3983_07265 [Capnocytophaga sp.]|nr:hypothetical protein [Capnocytophaga sp.]
MALENLINIEFSAEELEKIDGLLSQLEEVVKSKFINLTAEERKEYGRVGSRTEDWITRVRNYMNQYPDLVLRHIDTQEFEKDFAARQALLPRLKRLQAITTRFDDTTLLVGTDLYNASISYYKGVKASAQTNAPNAKVVYEDLKDQFQGRGTTKRKEVTE